MASRSRSPRRRGRRRSPMRSSTKPPPRMRGSIARAPPPVAGSASGSAWAPPPVAVGWSSGPPPRAGYGRGCLGKDDLPKDTAAPERRQAPEKEDPPKDTAAPELAGHKSPISYVPNSAASPRGCLGKEDLPKDTAAPGASSTPSARPLVKLEGATGKERRAERSAARSKARSASVPIPLCHSPPTYRAGQSVLWFWAPWFATAALDEAPETLKGRARPKWFTAVITAPAEARTAVYAGQNHNGQTYDVY